MNFKSYYFFLLFWGFYYNTQSQVLWQISGDNVTKWNYLDGDEFNGNSIDTSKWQDSYPWGRNLYCGSKNHYYTEFKNVSLNDGVLSLIARKEKIKARAVPNENDDYRLVCDGRDLGLNLRSFDYTCGMIFSKQKYHYGYYEIKFRSAEGKGLWPAFWLYAGHENDEIDIFEFNGNRNTELRVDVHCPDGCKNYKTTLGVVKKNWGDYLKTSGNWKDGFNVIGAEWQPGFIKWYLNGQVVAYWKGKFEFPMWVIANLAIAEGDGTFGPEPDASTKFPASFDIDYIRIWSKKIPSSKKTHQSFLSIPTAKTQQRNSKLTKGKKPESKKKYTKEPQIFVLLSPGENNNWFIEITGDIKSALEINVTDASGKMVFSIQDATKKVHQFSPGESGSVKIKIGDTLLEHTF